MSISSILSHPDNTSIEQLTLQRIIAAFNRLGFSLSRLADKEEPEFSFLLKKDNITYVVKVSIRNKPIAAHTVARFLEFCEQNAYNNGIVISLNGFSTAAITISATHNPNTKLMLGQYYADESNISFDQNIARSTSAKYISVFTQKGGVGKTTIAAHLAGAFALMGKSVALIDADPDQNLIRLITPIAENWYVQVPNPKTKRIDHSVRVFPQDQWQVAVNGKYDIVIIDYSPVFDKNPLELIKKTDFFITPVSLSPLELGEKAEIFHRTQQQIRNINKNARVLALINNIPKDLIKDQKNLLMTLQTVAKNIIKEPLTCVIEPQKCAIRNSQLLANWGKAPNLAFIDFAGKCYPREDFLRLADFIENSEFNN